MFFVAGLFAGELNAGMADLESELTAGAWVFISVASISLQDMMRHVLDTREIIRLAVPFGTNLLWTLALRLIEGDRMRGSCSQGRLDHSGIFCGITI
jgi:hypothetical protein